MLNTIYVLSRAPWHTSWWVSRQHLMTRLARRGWSIVYSTGPMNAPWASPLKFLSAGWHGSFKKIKEIDQGELLVDQAGRWPSNWTGLPYFDRMTLQHYAHHLMHAPISSTTTKRIVFVCHPAFWPLVVGLNPDRIVYYIHDAYLQVPGAPKHWRSYSEQIASRANLIISVAENMARDLCGRQANSPRLLPHGVDFEMIVKGETESCPLDLARIPHPRLGYTGRVNNKTDLKTLTLIAQRRPTWHWVIIGKVERCLPTQRGYLKILQNLKNVHFLGVRDREHIPAYFAHMDVNTILYRLDEDGYWLRTFPTKLFEYLAAGRPVVASALENILPYSSVLAPVQTPDEWVEAIERAIHLGGPGTSAARRAIAQQNTWEERVDLLEGWLERL